MAADSIHEVKAKKAAPPDDFKNVESATNEYTPTFTFTSAEHRALLWRQDLTILPLSAAIYLLCYLDRSNIGNAPILNSTTHSDMQTEIGATATSSIEH